MTAALTSACRCCLTLLASSLHKESINENEIHLTFPTRRQFPLVEEEQFCFSVICRCFAFDFCQFFYHAVTYVSPVHIQRTAAYQHIITEPVCDLWLNGIISDFQVTNFWTWLTMSLRYDCCGTNLNRKPLTYHLRKLRAKYKGVNEHENISNWPMPPFVPTLSLHDTVFRRPLLTWMLYIVYHQLS